MHGIKENEQALNSHDNFQEVNFNYSLRLSRCIFKTTVLIALSLINEILE